MTIQFIQRTTSRWMQTAPRTLVYVTALLLVGSLTAESPAQTTQKHVLTITNGIPQSLGPITFQVSAYATPLGDYVLAPGKSVRIPVWQTHNNTIFYIRAYRSGQLVAANRFGTDSQGVVHVTLKAKVQPLRYRLKRN